MEAKKILIRINNLNQKLMIKKIDLKINDLSIFM